jgi:hypothetical protein
MAGPPGFIQSQFDRGGHQPGASNKTAKSIQRGSLLTRDMEAKRRIAQEGINSLNCAFQPHKDVKIQQIANL